MKLFGATILGAALALAFVTVGNAAEPAPTTSANPPQVATNPGIPYSYGRIPGPKVSPNNAIPSPSSAATPSTTAPNPGAETTGSYYSGKNFGPKPN
jgi:hypothetical protein